MRLIIVFSLIAPRTAIKGGKDLGKIEGQEDGQRFFHGILHN